LSKSTNSLGKSHYICSIVTNSCNSEAYCRGAMHRDWKQREEVGSVDNEDKKRKEKVVKTEPASEPGMKSKDEKQYIILR
jgi:hypothetical protein